jgi:hypothetical protein
LAGKGENQWLKQRKQQLAALAEQGLRLLEAECLSEAESCYRQGLALDPLSARMCFNMAKLKYRQNKNGVWGRYLEAAVRLGPDDEELVREIKRFEEQVRQA